MTDSSFGIGLVGAGFISRASHAPSVEYIPGAHVAGVQNRTREAAATVAESCGGDPAVYGSDELTDLVRDPAVDGVWVTTPNFVRVDSIDTVVDAVAVTASAASAATASTAGDAAEEGRRRPRPEDLPAADRAGRERSPVRGCGLLVVLLSV